MQNSHQLSVTLFFQFLQAIITYDKEESFKVRVLLFIDLH